MEIGEIQDRLGQARLAVIGDFCLDVYWTADMRKSELSRETPHFPLPIVNERASAGGAGNVVANMMALAPKTVQCIGVFGDDWRGALYQKVLSDIGAEVSSMVTDVSRMTNAYIKPLRTGISDVIYEDPRIDFSNYSPLSEETEAKLLEILDDLDCDVLCVCDQLQFGCITEKVRGKILELGKEGMTVIVDSRDRVSEYRNVIVKPNDLEASRALGVQHTEGISELCCMANRLSCNTGRPAIITAGSQGCVVSENGNACLVPSIPVSGEIDICGAGDSFLSGLACGLSAGLDIGKAAQLGCMASSVTIRKLRTTGTANWQEITDVARHNAMVF